MELFNLFYMISLFQLSYYKTSQDFNVLRYHPMKSVNPPTFHFILKAENMSSLPGGSHRDLKINATQDSSNQMDETANIHI